jgi:hypothetical protein
MKKKLLQEQREKAIIESFAKTFNKIKRVDENYMDETYEEPWADLTINSNDLFYDPQYRATYEIYKLDPNSNDTNLKVYSDTDTSFIKTNTNILKKKIRDGKLVKVKEIITSANSGLDYSKWDKFKDTNPSEYNQKPEDQFMEKYPAGSQFKDSKYGAVKTIKKYEGDKVFIEDENMAGRMFQWPILYLIQGVAKKEYIPVEQPIDEINITEISKYGQTGILITNIRNASDAMRVKNLLDSQGFDGDGDDAVFAVTYGNDWWEDIEQEKNGEFGVLFSVLNVEEAKKIVNMIFTSDSKSPFYPLNRFDYEIINFKIGQYGTKTWKPIEGVKELDEINLKTLVPAAAMAVASMLPAKKAAAQDQMQQTQGIEKSADTSAALPQDALKLGKVIYKSYIQDPFTADMWSKKTRENLRFFKMVKKLYDYASNGGQIEYSDLEQLGQMAQESSVTANFLQRKKEDFNTARLEEDEAPSSMPSPEELVSLLPVDNYVNGIKIIDVNHELENTFFSKDGVISQKYPQIVQAVLTNEPNISDYFLPISIQQMVFKILSPIAIHYGYQYRGGVSDLAVADYAIKHDKKYALKEYMS